MTVDDQDKSWAPHFPCDYCKKTLEGKSLLLLLGYFYFYFRILWNGLAYSAFLKLLLCVLKDGIVRRREPWSLVFQEYGENKPTTQAIATFVWLFHPDVKLEKMLLPIEYPNIPSSIAPVCSFWSASCTNSSFYISPTLGWWVCFWRWWYSKWRIYLKSLTSRKKAILSKPARSQWSNQRPWID